MSEGNRIRQVSLAKSKHSLGTESARWLHISLLIAGLAGWMIFILACVGGPAWSPDGSQILFAYRDTENSRTNVALYDVRTGKTKTVFAQPAADQGEVAVEPEWYKDGTRALLAEYEGIAGSFDDGACVVLSIPVRSSLPLQAYPLGQTEGCVNMGPLPQLGDKVYFGGKDLRWIDLSTGEIERKTIGDEVGQISEHDGVVFYARGVSRSSNDAEGKLSKEDGTEFGQIDLKEFTFKPAFTLWKSDTAALGVTDDLSTVFWEPRGAGIAVIGPGDGADKILFLNESKGIVGVLAPDLGVKSFRLGNLVWSHDGKTLYASALTKGDQEKAKEYCLAEIPVDGTPGRLTKIAPIQVEKAGNDLNTFLKTSMQVSLSPDGNSIAATPAVLNKDAVSERDRALFLIDVSDPRRHFTRIPIQVHLVSAEAASKSKQ